MGWFSDDSDQAQAYNTLQDTPHKASITHELLAGAVSYEAAKAYEDHTNGNVPSSHAKAKEILAGLAGGFVDREVETKGLDHISAYEAKKHAAQQISDAYDSNPDPRIQDDSCDQNDC